MDKLFKIAIAELDPSPLPGDVVIFWRGSPASWEGHVVIWLELKEDYSVMSLALAFLFSRRQINTAAQNGQSLTTDFDGGFDSIKILPSGSESELLIQTYIRSARAYTKALTQASAFAGTIIFIALKVITGPYGSIRLGMEMIGCLALQKFVLKEII